MVLNSWGHENVSPRTINRKYKSDLWFYLSGQRMKLHKICVDIYDDLKRF